MSFSFKEKMLNSYKSHFEKKIFKSCYKHTTFDNYIYDDVLYNNPEIYDTIQKGNKYFSNFSTLAKDLFFSLYKENLTLRTPNELYPTSRYNLGILRQLEESEVYKELKKKCNLNILESSLSLATLCEELFKMIENKKKKELELLNKLNQLEQKFMEKLQRKIDQGDLENYNFDITDIDQFNDFLDEQELDNLNSEDNSTELTEQDLEDLINQMQDMIDNDFSNVDIKMLNMNNIEKDLYLEEQQQNKSDSSNNSQTGYGLNLIPPTHNLTNTYSSIKKLNKELDNMNSYFKSLQLFNSKGGKQYGNEAGYHSLTDTERVKAIYERIKNSRELKEIANLCGKFTNLVETKLKSKSKEKGVSIKSVTIGNEITKALSTEKLLLKSENTKKLFAKKFIEKQLLQYETVDDLRKGKGPLVICVDASGSMSGYCIEWAKSIAVALLFLASKKKRPYHVLFFDTRELYSYTANNGKYEPEDILNIAAQDANGGTSFDVPLTNAIEFIKTNPKFKKGDIVFITDGCCDVSSKVLKEIKEEKQRHDLLIQTILIGEDSENNDIEEWADKIIPLTDIDTDNINIVSDIIDGTLIE